MSRSTVPNLVRSHDVRLSRGSPGLTCHSRCIVPVPRLPRYSGTIVSLLLYRSRFPSVDSTSVPHESIPFRPSSPLYGRASEPDSLSSRARPRVFRSPVSHLRVASRNLLTSHLCSCRVKRSHNSSWIFCCLDSVSLNFSSTFWIFSLNFSSQTYFHNAA